MSLTMGARPRLRPSRLLPINRLIQSSTHTLTIFLAFLYLCVPMEARHARFGSSPTDARVVVGDSVKYHDFLQLPQWSPYRSMVPCKACPLSIKDARVALISTSFHCLGAHYALTVVDALLQPTVRGMAAPPLTNSLPPQAS